jgi:UDPglucose 6-dehydrogenase
VNGQPHPEVVNELPPMLIVGYGHVGRQIGRYFPDAHYVDADGVVRRVSDGLPTWRRSYDLGFLCVPTPEGPDGACCTDEVRRAYETWAGVVQYWCVKSTVAVGTTEGLGANACFSPEYYGETVGHPLAEPQRDGFVILGGPPDVTRAFATAWSLVTNSYTRIYQTDSKTAELVKLMENAWIATKVTFCNEFFDLAEAAGVDWHTLRELWLADPRVGRSHTYVYPGNRGFGGKCLPKDTANLVEWSRRIGRPARLIEAIRAYNTELRRGTKDS